MMNDLLKKVLGLFLLVTFVLSSASAIEAKEFSIYGGETHISYDYPQWVDNDSFLYVRTERHVKNISDIVASQEWYRDDAYIMLHNLTTDEDKEIFKSRNSQIWGMSYCRKTQKIYFSTVDPFREEYVGRKNQGTSLQAFIYEMELNSKEVREICYGSNPKISSDGDMLLIDRLYPWSEEKGTYDFQVKNDFISWIYFLKSKKEQEIKASLAGGFWDFSINLPIFRVSKKFVSESGISKNMLTSWMFWYDFKSNIPVQSHYPTNFYSFSPEGDKVFDGHLRDVNGKKIFDNYISNSLSNSLGSADLVLCILYSKENHLKELISFNFKTGEKEILCKSVIIKHKVVLP